MDWEIQWKFLVFRFWNKLKATGVTDSVTPGLSCSGWKSLVCSCKREHPKVLVHSLWLRDKKPVHCWFNSKYTTTRTMLCLYFLWCWMYESSINVLFLCVSRPNSFKCMSDRDAVTSRALVNASNKCLSERAENRKLISMGWNRSVNLRHTA